VWCVFRLARTNLHAKMEVSMWHMLVSNNLWINFFMCFLLLVLNFIQMRLMNLNKGWPTRWHLLYYILLNMFQTLIHPSSGGSEYLLCCVGWLEACWCYVAGLSVGDVVSECRLKMDVLTSETSWAIYKKASVI